MENLNLDGLTEIQKYTKICESYGNLYNYTDTTKKILVDKLGLDANRLREVAHYNLFYTYPKGTLTIEVATELLNRLNNHQHDFTNLANAESSLTTLSLKDGEDHIKYKIYINAITGVSTLSVNQ